MTKRLAGKCAIVTGAARGIGAAIATRMAADGADVALVDRADCSEIVAAIKDAGGRVRAFPCDVTDADAIAAASADLLVWAKGGLVLVNNAGAYPNTPLDTMELAQWRAVFALNVEAPMLFAQALARRMKSDAWGRIINIASSIVTIPRRHIAAYTASKMAVIGLTRALATDLGEFSITVNAISPGLTRTPGTEAHLGEAGRGLFEQFAQMQPLRRGLVPHDLAGVACFLASDDAAMITGQTLLVDGGLSRL